MTLPIDHLLNANTSPTFEHGLDPEAIPETATAAPSPAALISLDPARAYVTSSAAMRKDVGLVPEKSKRKRRQSHAEAGRKYRERKKAYTTILEATIAAYRIREEEYRAREEEYRMALFELEAGCPHHCTHCGSQLRRDASMEG
ncbi:hypothetical protein C8R45DRAFT_1094258 [Mycena sanguinolenta]|nr:hypothetical protein C8R45DRAFT_1094258 [Mycena sanguinolenta]